MTILSLRSAVAAAFVGSSLLLASCGGNKEEAKAPETPAEGTSSRQKSGPTPMVQQELGSIEQRDVEKTFNALQGKFERCHKEGRDRVEYLSGDVKVFLRISGAGKVRYGWFEETSLGDRDTEKCLFDVLSAADWPKPQGGEAEVRNGFGWPGGSERAPTSWSPDKVTGALDDAKDVKAEIAKCKKGVSGDFRITAYVEPGGASEQSDADDEPVGSKAKPQAAHGGGKSGKKKEKKHDGGHFKALGGAAPNKEGAEKVDCIVEALKPLGLPSPGSYAAKVAFAL